MKRRRGPIDIRRGREIRRELRLQLQTVQLERDGHGRSDGQRS